MSEPRVLLHVGAPKTGTSFVQDMLFTHRDLLRQQGILYPADRHDAHFLAALDLMELPWGGLEREAAGRWDLLAAEAREWPGTVIISHEILGRASRLQTARALASLGAPDREVHIVFSARDLVRQIPAEWQENVKHRRTKPYGTFLDDLRDPAREAEVAQWFWGVQEVPDVLDRWASAVPRERVHLVTVPPPGARPTLLWERFAGVFGIDPDLSPTERANASLGVPESTTVRRLNTRLNNVLDGYGYRRFVRGRPSVALDIKRPEAVATVLDLVEQADVLVEGMRPGTRRPRLGRGPGALVGQRARPAGLRRRRRPRRPHPQRRPATVRRSRHRR